MAPRLKPGVGSQTRVNGNSPAEIDRPAGIGADRFGAAAVVGVRLRFGWKRKSAFLSWDDGPCPGVLSSPEEGTFCVKDIGSRPRLVVSTDGSGVVGHAGARLPADLAEATGLTTAYFTVLRPLSIFWPGPASRCWTENRLPPNPRNSATGSCTSLHPKRNSEARRGENRRSAARRRRRAAERPGSAASIRRSDRCRRCARSRP